MQSLISTSTAFYGAGSALSRHSFVVANGPYSGRKLVFYPSDGSTLQFRYADPPYTSWSTPTEVASDAANFPASGWMDDDGNVYCVYTQQTTLNLIFTKLSFDLGEWTVESPVTIFDTAECYYPSLVRDSLGRLHVTFTWRDTSTGNYRIRYKRSLTDGLLWGSGSSDPGDDLTSGSSAAYSQLLHAAQYIYCVYTDAGSRLVVRELIDGGLLWGSEMVIHNGVFLSDRFSAELNSGGSLLGIAFEAEGKLQYIEYDRRTWGGVHEIADSITTPPLLRLSGTDAFVIYGVAQGTEQTALMVRRKQGAGFADAEPVGGEVGRFLDVILYDDDAGTQYQSRGSQAADSNAADVSHYASGALIAAVGDAVYFGASQPFAAITAILSTPGIGGEVAWEYFDGTDWQEFTPESGAYHFDQSSQLVRLWQDSSSAPSDWQASKIYSVLARWIRARVTTAFGTPPVGSQFTPLTEFKYISG